jgi:transcriptional regulator with XRE-family HTH domain
MALHFPEQSAMASTTLRKTLRSRGHRILIEVLVTARKAAGLNQRDLAARLKRPRSFVGRIESGERRIDVIEFIEIARVLEVDPRQLFAKILNSRP